MKKFLILYCVIRIIIFKSANVCFGESIVAIEETKIIGTHMITRHGRTISGFMGIPYAEPPIGRLRFIYYFIFTFSSQK